MNRAASAACNGRAQDYGYRAPRNEAANLLPVLAGVHPFADELLVVDGHS